jgi:hypothetical protein
MATNGLISSKSVCINGSDNSNLYIRVGDNGNSSIPGDIIIGGDLTVGGTTSLLDNVTIASNKNIGMTTDISNNTGLVRYTISGASYPLYPMFVRVGAAGTITRQASATAVPESIFTIPMDGYYSFTSQISLTGVGTIAEADNITIYLDVSGGSLTPVNGTINTIDMTKNAANNFNATPGGIIMQKLTAGQVLQLYHLEVGSFAMSGSIRTAYSYLGNTAI